LKSSSSSSSSGSAKRAILPVKSSVKGENVPSPILAQQLTAHSSYSSCVHAGTNSAATSSASVAAAAVGPNVAVFDGMGNSYPFGPPGFHGSSTVRYVRRGSGNCSSSSRYMGMCIVSMLLRVPVLNVSKCVFSIVHTGTA
jgi:hypothetical protein